jgi:hypothetical protein
MDLCLRGVVVVLQVVCEIICFEMQRCCGTRSVAEMAQVCSVLLDLRNPREVESRVQHVVANRAQQLRDNHCTGYSIELLDRGYERFLSGDS